MAWKTLPLLMHLDYKVMLPDHNFAFRSQHKLNTSILYDMEIISNNFSGEAVLYRN